MSTVVEAQQRCEDLVKAVAMAKSWSYALEGGFDGYWSMVSDILLKLRRYSNDSCS